MHASALDVLIVLGGGAHPPDGVSEYSARLCASLRRRGHQAAMLRLAWDEVGWLRAIARGCAEVRAKTPDWIMMQYTHLMWSRHGFPLQAIGLALVLRLLRVRLAVVIHDPSAFPGERLRDRVRGYVQHSTMRWLRRAARAVVVTVPVDRVAWLSHVERGTLRFIPVGANIEPGPDARPGAQGLFTLTVFGVTQGKWKEIEDIAAVARRVADELGGLKLVVVGRGSEDAEPHLRSLLRNAKLHLEVGGVESANRVSRLLSMSDACLCVRGGISSRRGTVVAAIAHGLPVVGYVCAETGPPVTNAGVVLVPAGDVEGLARALIQIARDRSWSDTLRDRNRRAYEAHFAWDRIAAAWEGCLTRQPATY